MKGSNILGYKYSALANSILQAMNPATLKMLEGAFHIATDEEIDEALFLAEQAFQTYKNTSAKAKAKFLNAIADEILKLGDTLVNRACEESGLPAGRITGERGRTINQLRLFASILEEGSWVDAVIDNADPDRKPFPKADIRRMLVPIGPVAVFTASNFPLAFSTAGGDTASALASGCPVVVKAHESHLGTNALVSFAIQKAAKDTGMPDGVFSSLNGTGLGLGQKLVKHPLTKAIAFTGSHRAGKSIFDLAAQREVPIPVYAEMGSTNPVFLMEGALKNKGEALAKQLAGSVTLGAGQFCTNPGMLIGIDGPELKKFQSNLIKHIKEIPAATMLNKGICNNFQSSKERLSKIDGVTIEYEADRNPATVTTQITVATVSAKAFLENTALHEEVFGPFTIIIKAKTRNELHVIASSLKGQLTTTIMGSKSELKDNKDLINILQDKAGRLIFNNVPTGVEVGFAMQHGGPYPASTDSKTTSVGTAAITRFARPLAFQNWDNSILPDALKNNNPLKIMRKIDGKWTADKNG